MSRLSSLEFISWHWKQHKRIWLRANSKRKTKTIDLWNPHFLCLFPRCTLFRDERMTSNKSSVLILFIQQRLHFDLSSFFHFLSNRDTNNFEGWISCFKFLTHKFIIQRISYNDVGFCSKVRCFSPEILNQRFGWLIAVSVRSYRTTWKIHCFVPHPIWNATDKCNTLIFHKQTDLWLMKNWCFNQRTFWEGPVPTSVYISGAN